MGPQALTLQQLDEVKANLSSVLKKGEKLYLNEKVDPSLIGGFVIDIGAQSPPSCCSCRGAPCERACEDPRLNALKSSRQAKLGAIPLDQCEGGRQPRRRLHDALSFAECWQSRPSTVQSYAPSGGRCCTTASDLARRHRWHAGDKHMDMSIISRVKKVQHLIMEATE